MRTDLRRAPAQPRRPAPQRTSRRSAYLASVAVDLREAGVPAGSSTPPYRGCLYQAVCTFPLSILMRRDPQTLHRGGWYRVIGAGWYQVIGSSLDSPGMPAKIATSL